MSRSPSKETQTDIESALGQYASLVRKYASTLNLSSPDVLEKFETAIQNSEEYDEFLEPELYILDIGSGVGLPGIPMAIRHPDLQVTLCEIRKRRAAFLERAISLLLLENVHVYNGDVKQLAGQQFDVVIAQAVGRLADIYRMCEHLLKPKWVILTRKGANLNDELDELKNIRRKIQVSTRPLDDGTMLVAIHGGTA
jgi:16S rRNA (guanine527-N7)-methyltransferase